MQTKERNDLIFLRLFPDEDVFEKLTEACKKHNVKSAIVLSAVGQLQEFQLGYFKEKGNYTPEEFQTPYELLSLSGIISQQNDEYEFHLHALLGGEDKKVVGGHLIKGKVAVTNEIVLLKADLKIERKLEEKTGLKGMFLQRED